MLGSEQILKNHAAAKAALQWCLDHGVDTPVGDAPVNAYAPHQVPSLPEHRPYTPQSLASPPVPRPLSSVQPSAGMAEQPSQAQPMITLREKCEAAKEAANRAATVDDLQAALQGFDALDIKRTAQNLVFSEGDPTSDLMVICDMPAAEDERQARPLAGQDGVLFDRALAAIGRARSPDENAGQKGLYLTYVLNWRPPGNRTPLPAELSMALPFIERHIAVVKPKVILLCGAVTGKTLLNKREGISRLRKANHLYTTQTQGLNDAVSDIPAISTYTPSYVMNTPLQKRALWMDLLKLKRVLETSDKEGGKESI